MAIYRCPLCLHPLDSASRLRGVCMSHDVQKSGRIGVWEIKFAPERIFCRKGLGHCNEMVGLRGVFLTHVGCTAPLPELMPPVSGSRMSGVDHWEIALVDRMTGPGLSGEMWFPAMLLRATAEERDGRRIGATVTLTGAQEVGKTVLALQSMDTNSYDLDGGESIHLGDFIYCRPTETTGNDGRSAAPASAAAATAQTPYRSARWLELLRLSWSLRVNQPLSAPAGTKPLPGDLLATFIIPAPHPLGPRPSRPSVRPATVSERIGFWLRELKRQLVRVVNHARTNWMMSRGNWAYAVAFYDTAGELAGQQYAPVVDELDAAADAAAIFIDGAELLEQPPHKSVTVALNRLNQLVQQRQIRRALVVTKTDLLMKAISAPGCPDVPSEKDFETIMKVGGDSFGYLERVLRASPPSLEKTELANRLKNEVNDVFFVATQDFTKGTARSLGLLRFICWCLSVDRKDLVLMPK